MTTPAARLFHLALDTDWRQALEAGDYRVSTRGRTLEEEGFVHMSFAHQVPGVLAAYFADDPEPLVLLEVEPTLLDVPIRVETPPGELQAFPHVYGPIPLGAVVAVHPDPRGGAPGR